MEDKTNEELALIQDLTNEELIQIVDDTYEANKRNALIGDLPAFELDLPAFEEAVRELTLREGQ
jgi:hypothetical protein